MVVAVVGLGGRRMRERLVLCGRWLARALGRCRFAAPRHAARALAPLPPLDDDENDNAAAGGP
jgi:hypothetical protein